MSFPDGNLWEKESVRECMALVCRTTVSLHKETPGAKSALFVFISTVFP